MSTNPAATTRSSSRRRRSGASRFPPRVLLSTTALVGINSNRTAATCLTRNGATVKVSFCFKRPPESSTLFVYCPDISSFVEPDIVCSADDLLLICVNVGLRRCDISPEDCDYFVYRASSSRPFLELLPRPHPSFHNCDVGVLPHSNGHYTIADGDGMFMLHLFHSDTSSWSSSMVTEDEDTSSTSYRVDDWTLTTWINRKMSGSLDDWSGQHEVQASKIRIHNPAVLAM